jgi:hypothetical protein
MKQTYYLEIQTLTQKILNNLIILLFKSSEKE